jgi:hypothetical protein
MNMFSSEGKSSVVAFYHIYISPKSGVNQENIQEKMDLAIDWFHYHQRCWIVYTSSDADKWQRRLEPLVEPDGDLFICRLDMTDCQGWMDKEFWAWIKSKRS